MSLPTFLGIGAQRSGTTWLHVQLGSHPAVFVPKERKEIHYFDWNYERGQIWYEKWFPPEPDIRRYEAVGEITPEYLFDEAVPPRIAATIGSPRMIALLRHPVDRAYSQYCLRVQKMGEKRSFEQFYNERPDVLARGLYGRSLARFLEWFDRDRFLVLIYERVMAEPEEALTTVAKFLDISPGGFDTELPERRIHSGGYHMRCGTLFNVLRRIGKMLEAMEMDGLRNLVKRPIMRVFQSSRPIGVLDTVTRNRLYEDYRDDIALLRQTWGVDVSCWEKDPNGPLQTPDRPAT